MNNLIKYFLNFFDPETAHKLAVSMLSSNHFVSYRTKDLYTKIFKQIMFQTDIQKYSIILLIKLLIIMLIGFIVI